MSARDLALEADFLDAAERRAGVGGCGFAENASVRLDLGEQRYGDRWQRKGLAYVLVNAREECWDLGGWPALAVQSSFLEQRREELDADTAVFVRLQMQAVAALGAQANSLVNETLDAYAAARRL